MRGNSLRSGRPANSMDQDSFDSFDDIEEMVMATNNLSLSPNSRSEANQDSLNVSGEEDELPRCIIVTNVDSSVFDTIDIKVRDIYFLHREKLFCGVFSRVKKSTIQLVKSKSQFKM